MKNRSPNADSHGVSTSTSLHKGMKNRSPSSSDSSTTCKGGSVSSEPTRKNVAATPKTLGPRTA
jgi:hypothetical protein